jgi:hypothetical protein
MTTLATKRALIGGHLTKQSNDIEKVMKYFQSVVGSADATEARYALISARINGEKARIEAGKL